MAQPPPVPASSNPVPPPLVNFRIVAPNGFPTLQFISFLTQMWAGQNGEGGSAGAIVILQAEVATIFALHGDGTLSAEGVLTVTGTEGVGFGPFATGTDAAALTGTLNAARIAANSLPYTKLVNLPVLSLLGAAAAGPVVALTIGAGLVFNGTATTLVDEATIVSTVAALPAQPYPRGRRRFVSDATAPAFGAPVVGGGAVPVPVFSDGLVWNVG